MTTPPRRINLANIPTPLMKLDRTSEYLGVEFLIKRDDMTGFEMSGNKVRKLEYLVAEALDTGADTLVTCGGEQSNHCRATAMAAARVGLQCELLLRIPNKENPPQTTGNILLDRMAGARIHWIDRDEWSQIDKTYAAHEKRLRGAGRKPYWIPTGGSNALGSFGYVRCVEELARELPSDDVPTTIVYACGSGGTGVGLVAGNKMTGLENRNVSVCGFNVSDSAEYFISEMVRIGEEFVQRFDSPALPPEDFWVIDGYVGKGYAKSRTEELQEIVAMTGRDAILLDPVYNGKAFFGLVNEIRKNRSQFGERIVFIHTGGAFALFPRAATLDKLMTS